MLGNEEGAKNKLQEVLRHQNRRDFIFYRGVTSGWLGGEDWGKPQGVPFSHTRNPVF